ncbi:M48 family metalloprotease [Pseudofrankia inefficax]|uniref:Peptidase M48 Ste24p n=1 Tax=Pseudofrankia inefficax (strain DSM 45817 / CECT 9037 / DDB 130130 / EuI1c) TaxID=298654 RepID=E3IV73_PSEI1|nr:M48 family metalloprotease [Pseudofrankia inefficax]ADP80093.1 peptidase M48 Ste24p [Pseudofrankia inefficax]
MLLSVCLAGAAALVLLAVARPAARRLPPARAALLLATSALGGAAVWVIVVGLLAVLLVGQAPPVAAVGRWSARLVGAGDPVPTIASVAAWVAVAVGLAGAVMLARRLVAEARRWLPAYRSDRCAGVLVVVDDPEPAALAVPGWPGRIVVSSGMLRALPAEERRVLLAHEHCHLSHAHWLFRFVVRLAAAACPLARPYVAACDHALERWADEAAAAATGDRRLTAQAVARAALARHDAARTTAAAFTDGHISDRVAALLAPPPRRRWLPAAAPLVVLAIAAVCALLAGHDVHELFEFARYPGHGA